MEALTFRKLFLWPSVFIALLFASSISYADNAAQIQRATREVDNLGTMDKLDKQLKRAPKQPIEEIASETTPDTQAQKFFIKKITLKGCETFPAEDFAPLVSKYENREISLDDLNALGRQIEREYLNRGIIAAVFVPAQETKNQTIALNVVEAKMGELEIQKHKYFNNARLKYYWDIFPGEAVRYDEMTKSLQIINKNPDRQVKATLHAGKAPGTTDVMLAPGTNFPAHLLMSFDNEGVPITGRSRKGIGTRHNNFLGLDDTLLGGYTYGKEFSGRYVYHNIPVGYNGASFLYGFSYSKSSPKEEYTENILRSQMTDTTVSLHQDLFKKSGEYLGEAYGAFNTSNKAVTQNTGVYSKDILRVVNLGGTYIKKGFGSVTTINPEINQGLDAFGSSSRGNPLASRGAKSAFTRFNLSVQHKRALPLNLQGNLRFRGQLASSKLMPQQEFGLGGIDSVRGYPPSDYLADNSVVTNAELLVPAIFIPGGWQLPFTKEKMRDQVTTLAFIDYGWGMRKGALITEQSMVNFVGVGAGLRVRFFDQAFIRLEYGQAVGMPATTAGGNGRFHFSVDFEDKLPEKIEQAKKMIEENNIKQWSWQIINAELNRPDSPIRKKMEYYLCLARACYKHGLLEQTKEYYEKVDSLGNSLYTQTEDYVRAILINNKKLREENTLALVSFKEGDLKTAQAAWQKIIEQAKLGSLVLEF
ncbi:MAG: ShlB/FhaC/HecB family hemolysin secretion/activation protein [Candidatus Omnitrophota bacterium]